MFLLVRGRQRGRKIGGYPDVFPLPLPCFVALPSGHSRFGDSRPVTCASRLSVGFNENHMPERDNKRR